MAKGRMINRTLAKSSKFTRLENDFYRLVYCMMLPFTDRDGKLDGDPCSIRSDCFPKRRDLSIEAIQSALVALNASGLIVLYTVDGEQYIKIINFTENQVGMKYDRESESNIPDPEEIRIKSGCDPDVIPPKVKESKVKESNTSGDFDLFYSKYPKKRNKDKAFTAFKKRSKDLPPIDDLISIIEKWIKTEEWKKDSGKFIPYPASWINAGGWFNELPGSVTETQKQEYHKRATAIGRCLVCGKQADLRYGKCEECTG